MSAVLLSAGSCVPAKSPEDDALHARIAAGCRVTQECIALYEQAHKRWGDCVNEQGSSGRGDCRGMLADKIRASELKDQAISREREEMASAQREDSQRHANTLAEQGRRDGEEKKRRARVDELVRTIRDAMQRTDQHVQALPELERPADISENVGRVEGALKELRELDAEAAKSLDGDVAKWAAAAREGVAREEKCRVTAACMADRIAVLICDAVGQRNAFSAEMARERANPSGVVNLNALHSLGQDIQNANDTIATHQRDYAKLMKRTFNEGACKKK